MCKIASRRFKTSLLTREKLLGVDAETFIEYINNIRQNYKLFYFLDESNLCTGIIVMKV